MKSTLHMDACNSAIPKIGCEGDNFGEDDDEDIKRCLGNIDDARDVGDVCEESLISLLNCLGDLACMDIGTWRDDSCGEVTPDYCGPESAAFCEQCPGVWYAE